MNRQYKRGFDIGNFEITKREILASITIIAVMLCIGFFISDKISQRMVDKNDQYNKALTIDNNTDMFIYNMSTNIGKAFVYGELKALDTVSYDCLENEYMYVKRVKEEYTRHTKQVKHTSTDSKGNKTTYYTTETYYTWDTVKTENKNCNQISFCGVSFDYSKINVPGASYISTEYINGDTRWLYYGTDTSFVGTIYTDLRNNTILDNTSFYKNQDINSTKELLSTTSSVGLVLFWILWIVVICGLVFGFYYLDNKWLEN